MNHMSSFTVFAVTLIIVIGVSQLLSVERSTCNAIASTTGATVTSMEVARS